MMKPGQRTPAGPGRRILRTGSLREKGNLIFELALSPLHEDGHSMLRAQPVPQAFRMRQHSTWTP